ncbi:MAG: hypothetical protein JSV62_04905 [Promethearchaeota archaeon]|nr:MAG: hypothetical protein JSV62_04905 [Candidatus Lokiarchaeota archaeon]
MNRIMLKDGWRTWDTAHNIFFPWYTRPFLEKIIEWDTRNWKVFEYGAGDSTEWWRKNAKTVEAIDTNENWATKTQAKFISDRQEFIEYPKKLVTGKNDKFDCIIIDSEPVEWRDECTYYALQSIKSGGVIIIDNYEQGTVNLAKWTQTNSLLSGYQKYVFKEPTHVDWKTAYWIIR